MSDGRAWDEGAKQQAIDYILDAMAAGQSVTRTLQLPMMPAPGTFARWRADDPTLQERYLRAREALADHWADEVVPIADGATDSDSAAAARVRVDARRWAASKFSSAYADRVDVGLGAGGGLQIVLNRYEAPRVSGTIPQALPSPTPSDKA
jgi:hypothetical protein